MRGIKEIKDTHWNKIEISYLIKKLRYNQLAGPDNEELN